MIVLDCSIALGAKLPDEDNPYALSIIEKLAEEEVQGIVPAIFYLECGNVLQTAYRKKRINTEEWQEYLDVIANLALVVDHHAANAESLMEIAKLADEFDLTTYDAAYLELAKRKYAPLVTLDKKLQRVANHLRLLL